VKDGGQKPETLMREMGCKHEERSNANSLKTLLGIESGSLVRDFWSAVEYGGIPEFFGQLKARGHALMAK